MSGSGEIMAPVVGGAVLVPLAALAVTAGAAVLAGKALVAGTKFAVKQAEIARENRLGRSLDSFTGRIDNLNLELNRKLALSAENIQNKYEKEINAIREMAHDEADVTDYIRQCAAVEERMLEELERSRETIEQEAADTIVLEKKKMSLEISEKRADLEASVKKFENDIIDKEEQSRVVAKNALEQAAEAVQNVRETYNCTAEAKRLCGTLEQALSGAERRFDEKQYEAAIVVAYAVIDQAATGVVDILEAERHSSHCYNKCTTALQEIKNYLSELRSIEYTFKDTNSGEPRIIKIEDFSLFFGEEWQRTTLTSDRVGAVLESASHGSFAYEELSDLLRELNEAKAEFAEGVQTAYKRLHNASLREEWADTIAQGYVEMGYQEIDPGEDYDPVEKTVMMFESDDGEDYVKVTLRPEMTAGGDMEIRIDVDDHTEDLGKEGLERERVARREEICERLSSSPLGQKLGVMASQTCKTATRNRNAF